MTDEIEPGEWVLVRLPGRLLRAGDRIEVGGKYRGISGVSDKPSYAGRGVRLLNLPRFGQVEIGWDEDVWSLRWEPAPDTIETTSDSG